MPYRLNDLQDEAEERILDLERQVRILQSRSLSKFEAIACITIGTFIGQALYSLLKITFA